MFRRHPPVFAVALPAALLSAAAIGAQTAPAPDAAADPDRGDITVTAERREQKLQDVPAAVTAIGAQRIEDEAILNLGRIGADVPNLYLNRNFGTTSGALVFLRGVGEGDSIFTNDPPVGIYVDDVILPRSTGSLLDLIDVERIEVLRGPQGTLYGRNTSGGAIKLVTRRPSFDRVDGIADLTVGSYGRIDGRATINLPVGETLAFRVSGLSRNQRGWGTDLTNGARVDGQDLKGGRVSMLWQPTAALDVYATGDLGRERSTPRYPQQFLPDPARPGRYLPVFRTPGGDIDAFPSADTMPLNDTDTGGLSLRLDYALGGVTLRSITAARSLRSRIGFDQTANPPGMGANVTLLQDQRQHDVSQEFQIAGKALGGRVDWLAGAYYFFEHNDQLTAISSATPAGTAAARFRNDDFFNAPSRGAGTGGNWSPYLPRLDTHSYSVFGSATAALGPRAHLTAGLRYTDENKRYDVSFLSAPGTVLVLPDGRQARRVIAQRWTDVSPRVTADYRLGGGGDDRWQALAYATVSKGFRSGSFDGRARNIDFVLNRQGAIAPETVWNYEAGVKTGWLGDRLHVNADYFVNTYTDIAFSAARAGSNPPEIFRQNVGDARLQGLEAEWSARPWRAIELGGWIATLADRFTRLKSSPGCTAYVPDEYDLDLRFTPSFRYQVRAAVTHGRWRIGGDYSGATPYFTALCNEPQHRVDNAETANAQIGYDHGAWSATLAVFNLFDRRYNTGSVGVIGYPSDPRQATLQLRRRF